MRHTSTSCKILALLLLIIMLTGCASRAREAAPDEKHQSVVFAMDTVMTLAVYGENGDEILKRAEERIRELESDLDPASESGSVFAVNKGAGTSTPVTDDMYNVMSTAMEYRDLSGGALDPGLYPISRAWGFIGGDYRVPPRQEILDLLGKKDTASIVLNETERTVMIPAGTEISLGAVAKGYAAQEVIDLMRDAGAQYAILSLGGNVQTLGETKPDGSPWQVAVIDPHDTGSYAAVLSVGETAVVTSGGYQRFFEKDGKTYIHILDPQTGMPVDNGLLSVTVVAADGASADALSTALFVMGEEAALALQGERGDFELVLVTEDGRVVVTRGLADRLEETSGDYAYEYVD